VARHLDDASHSALRRGLALVGDDLAEHRSGPVLRRARHEHGAERGLIRQVGVVEHQLRHVPGVLVEGGHLVLLVRPAVRRSERAVERVRRHVVEHEVAGDGAAGGECFVVGELGERDRRLEVLLVVHVRVPLAEPVAGALFDPPLDQRLGVSHVVAAGRAVVGEGLVGERLPGEVLDRVEQDLVVLRPVPALVDDARRLGLVVPVLEGEDQSLHVLPGLRERRSATIGPIPEVEQGDHVEVGRVGERREPFVDRRQFGGCQVDGGGLGDSGEAGHGPPHLVAARIVAQLDLGRHGEIVVGPVGEPRAHVARRAVGRGGRRVGSIVIVTPGAAPGEAQRPYQQHDHRGPESSRHGRRR
jgi:hypothetical protein